LNIIFTSVLWFISLSNRNSYPKNPYIFVCRDPTKVYPRKPPRTQSSNVTVQASIASSTRSLASVSNKYPSVLLQKGTVVVISIFASEKDLLGGCTNSSRFMACTSELGVSVSRTYKIRTGVGTSFNKSSLHHTRWDRGHQPEPHRKNGGDN